MRSESDHRGAFPIAIRPGSAAAGLLGSTSLMSSDLPFVAARIPNHSAPISVWHIGRLLEAYRARLERALVSRIDVVNVEVKKSGHRIARADAAYHDDRVADSEGGR